MHRRTFMTSLVALGVASKPLFAQTQPAAAPVAAPVATTPAAPAAAAPAVKPVAAPKQSWPIAPQFYPTEVAVKPELAVGSIIVVSDKFFLYHIIAPGKAMRYGVAVGKTELQFRGQATVARKVEWPSWKPTPEMVKRNPSHYAKYAETGMPGGPGNPLGPRAMYLFQNGHDTGIRIHGTIEPSSIGHAVSNGCLRMENEHVIELYKTVAIGTPVTVY